MKIAGIDSQRVNGKIYPHKNNPDKMATQNPGYFLPPLRKMIFVDIVIRQRSK